MDIELIREILDKNNLNIEIFSTPEFNKRYLKLYKKFSIGTYGDRFVGLHFDDILTLSKNLKQNSSSHISLKDLTIKISLLVALHEIGHRKDLEHCHTSSCFLTIGELAYLKNNQIRFCSSICDFHLNKINNMPQFKEIAKNILDKCATIM